jgi:hypothetical protein
VCGGPGATRLAFPVRRRYLRRRHRRWRFFDRFQPRPTNAWEQQAAWLDYQMDLGVSLAASAGGHPRSNAGKEQFKDALCSIARVVDRQRHAAAGDRGDVEAARLVLA